MTAAAYGDPEFGPLFERQEPMKPITPLMWKTLKALHAAEKPLTCNVIARKLGFIRGQDDGRHSHNGRAMGPAQRVIFPIIGLRQRGLVGYGPFEYDRSGTTYVITLKGREAVETLQLLASER